MNKKNPKPSPGLVKLQTTPIKTNTARNIKRVKRVKKALNTIRTIHGVAQSLSFPTTNSLRLQLQLQLQSPTLRQKTTRRLYGTLSNPYSHPPGVSEPQLTTTFKPQSTTDKMVARIHEMAEEQSKLSDSRGIPIDPFSDPKNPLYVPKPKIDDDSNPYSLATRHDNQEYARQVTILNSFQHGLSQLKGFMDPFLNKPKQHEKLPSTLGEMNAMLQHAILNDNDYELGWTRFTAMINAVPDYLKSWLEQSLFDQFNEPTLFRRDADVNANENKVLFTPDQRSYQLIMIACLQAMEKIKVDYDPEIVNVSIKLAKFGTLSNSLNDDESESQSTLMLRQLQDIKREIERRKLLPIDEQDRLLRLENGGLGHIDDGSNGENYAAVGLHHAVKNLKSTDFGLSNKHEYDPKLGITEYEMRVQKGEKLLAQGQTIIDLVPSGGEITPNGHKYKANRKIQGDDSEDDDPGHNDLVIHDDNHNDKHTTINNNHNQTKQQPVQHKYGLPLLTATKTKSGKFKYKISLPQLPFGIKDGEELDYWLDKLSGISTVSLEVSQELQTLRDEFLKDPFSPEYHCYQQVKTWHGRLNFIMRDVLEHYYSAIWLKNPALWKFLRSSETPPKPNLSGVTGYNDAVGYNTEMLTNIIAAAKDQNNYYVWLEATALKSKLTPSTLHVPTLDERKMMIREQFIKDVIFDDILSGVPTGDDQSIDLINIAKHGEKADADVKQQQGAIPKLTPPQLQRCIKLFQDYGVQVNSYIKAVKNYDVQFLADLNIQKVKSRYEPVEKMLPTDNPAFLHYQAAQKKQKEDADAKEKDLHQKFRQLNDGEVDFKTAYQSPQFGDDDGDDYDSNNPDGDDNGDDNDTEPQKQQKQQKDNNKSKKGTFASHDDQKEFMDKFSQQFSLKLGNVAVHSDFVPITFADLTQDQIRDYKLRRPQPLQEMVAMDRLVKETIRRYPLLGSLAPKLSSHYKSLDDIITTRYGSQSKLHGLIRNIKLDQIGLPTNSIDINVKEFGFDSIEKLLSYPYPKHIQEQINTLKISMVKVPSFNTVLVPPEDIQVDNDASNYQHLLLTPSTNLITINEAIEFINQFTAMGKVVQAQEIEYGQVEEVQEYTYQINYQQFLQQKYQKMVKISQISNNSLNIRNMSRLGMYYIDTMIISWAAQQNKRLPPGYCRLVSNSYSTLTNDVFNQDINRHSDDNNNSNNSDNSDNSSNLSKSPTTKQHELESASLQHDLSLTNPPRSRIEQWRQRTFNDALTNPTKFYSLSIDERVELIDKTNEEEKANNVMATFFHIDPTMDKNDPKQPYHLLRSYLRFAIRAGDEESLEKALMLYRSTSKLLEYVQRRTNEDVYVDGGEKMFDAAQNEEEFQKMADKVEKYKLTQQQIEDEIPAAMRADMTRDDIKKSTTKMGEKTKLWNSWYGAENNLTGTDSIQKSIQNDPRSQNNDNSEGVDQLVHGSGMLDDYADRINALLSAKHKKLHDNINNTDDSVGDVKDIVQQEINDEKDVQLYRKMIQSQKSKKLGKLFVPGYDDSDQSDDDDDDDDDDGDDNNTNVGADGISKNATSKDLEIARKHLDADVELDPSAKSSSPTKSNPSKKSFSTEMSREGRMTGTKNDDNNDETEAQKNANIKHAPHTRLSKLSTASHIPYDYMLTQMVINFHQLLIRNGSTLQRVGLPADVHSKRFSDEVTAHWALARRRLYDQRIALIHSFDDKINKETGVEYTTAELRERSREKAKVAVKMLKKNRSQDSLADFEREAGQLAIMTLDTLILEGFVPVAKVTAKQAYDDGLLSKEFIETLFQNHGPDLESTPEAILGKEFGLSNQ